MHLLMMPWAPYTLATFLGTFDLSRANHCRWFAQGSPWSDQCIYRIMYEFADAVEYLHNRPIKHKELKPETISYTKKTPSMSPQRLRTSGLARHTFLVVR